MIVGAVTTPSPLLAWLLASVGGVALYLFLLRRDRDEDEDGPTGPLMAVPAVASAGAAPPPPGRSAAVSAPVKAPSQPKGKTGAKVAAAGDAASAPIEATPAVAAAPDDSLPLAATLSAAAARAAAAAKAPTEARKFDKPPAKGVKRYTVAYRHVRISETTDEVRSRELGRLDRGDEVELIDSFEGALQVRTPDGVVGWIPRQTIVG